LHGRVAFVYGKVTAKAGEADCDISVFGATSRANELVTANLFSVCVCQVSLCSMQSHGTRTPEPWLWEGCMSWKLGLPSLYFRLSLK
jgi:hypothetical protein